MDPKDLKKNSEKGRNKEKKFFINGWSGRCKPEGILA